MPDGSYRRTEWVNEQTRLNEQNLNNIEEGINEALNKPNTINIGDSESTSSPYTTIILGKGIKIIKDDSLGESSIRLNAQRVLVGSLDEYNDNLLSSNDIFIVLSEK